MGQRESNDFFRASKSSIKFGRGLVVFLTVVGIGVPSSVSFASARNGAIAYDPIVGKQLSKSSTSASFNARSIGSQINVVLPSGVLDATEPSGQAPPGPNSFPGNLQSYVTDFSGTSLPLGWHVFTGSPAGDPSAQWGEGHVVVGGGLLQLNAFQDPLYHNSWVTGGLCQCGVARTYGSYFVRSRLTGPGPTLVELLWPRAGWPPEIDFNETYGTTGGSMATDHYTVSNFQIHRTVHIDMTQWHTWGVIWTPTIITYTVDGSVWGTVVDTAAIPNQAMTLDLQQQTWCGQGWACPSIRQSTLIDWVAEYTPSVYQSSVVGPFKNGSTSLSPSLQSQIMTLASRIRVNGNPLVTLAGFGDSLAPTAKNASIGRSRASAVERFLRSQLSRFGLRSIKIVASKGTNGLLATRASPSRTTNLHKVIVSIN